MTFADKIRSMTDEELAIWIFKHDKKCKNDGFLSIQEYYDILKQEIPAPPQKEPLCLSCAHANISVTDDFADCLCAVSSGYEGGKTECKDYERKQRNDGITL